MTAPADSPAVPAGDPYAGQDEDRSDQDAGYDDVPPDDDPDQHTEDRSEDRSASPAGDINDADERDEDASSTLALWEGDDGGLSASQRRALVALLKHRFISARTHQREWAALVANPRPLRARLNDLFMDLHIDPRQEVAYKRPVNAEGGGRPYPTLLYDAPWGREETLLLVFLRTRHRSDQAAGADRAFVDRAAMLDFIAQHRPAGSTDVSGDDRKAAKAVESIFKTGLLIGASTAERFEISGAIEVLMPMEKLKELLEWLQTTNTVTVTPLTSDVQLAVDPTVPSTHDSDIPTDESEL